MPEPFPNNQPTGTNRTTIFAALIAGAATVLTPCIPIFLQQGKSNDLIIDKLNEKIEVQSIEIEELKEQLSKLRSNSSSEKIERKPLAAESFTDDGLQPNIPKVEVPVKLKISQFGDYKIEPIGGLTANVADGIITFEFNLSNVREDKSVYISTSNSVLIGEDNFSRDAESACISNSTIARPNGSTSRIRLFQNFPLKGYIKFKTAEKLKEAHVISFYVSNQEVKYTGKFPIKWDE
jgi:hypothetical protein